MCGIAGAVRPARQQEPAVAELVDAMCRRMRHRGPDDLNVRTDGEVALGISRLAIVDLVGGRQPLTSEDESVVAVVNGEIYNHHQLRRELIAAGHRFRTASDAEVVVHLYEEAGIDC